MQYARLLDDGRTWEASQFAQLPAAEIESKRRNLVCVECGEIAWYRKESAHGHPPHFCAHHTDDCKLKVVYAVVGDPRRDATEQVDQVSDGESIVVRLDEGRGGAVEVTPVQPSPNGSAAGGTRYVGAASERESAQHFTLRRILYRLVQSPTFRVSDKNIAFYRDAENLLVGGRVNQVIVEFAKISRTQHHERLLLYWGPISSAGKSPDGKLWLNSSDRHQAVSVAIFEDVVDEFLRLFNVQDYKEELGGAHVLVAGRCNYSSNTGKPVIWCGSSKYIFVRRYRDEQFDAKL
jgi:hypothetical protein